jgi:hypothetical protein
LLAQQKIDLRFLDELQKTKFSSRVRKLTRWYAAAFEAFKKRNELPYAPTLFVVPFYVRLESRVGNATLIIPMIGLTSLDPDDPYNKWAIYIPYSVIKNAPKEIVMANLAHEVCHFSLRSKGVGTLPANEILQAVKAGGSSVDLYWIKEREVSNIETLFDEPIRTMILKMEEQKAKDPDVVKKYVANTPEITQDEFYDMILGGHQVAEKVLEEHSRRLKACLGCENGSMLRTLMRTMEFELSTMP